VRSDCPQIPDYVPVAAQHSALVSPAQYNTVPHLCVVLAKGQQACHNKRNEYHSPGTEQRYDAVRSTAPLLELIQRFHKREHLSPDHNTKQYYEIQADKENYPAAN